MIAAASRRRRRLDAQINMVPFIDVVLVLLVIFMVTAPLLSRHEMRVNLPEAATTSEMQEMPIVVAVDASNEIRVNERLVSGATLEDELRALLAERGEKTVVVGADRDASHGSVVAVLDAAKAAGATGLSLAAVEKR